MAAPAGIFDDAKLFPSNGRKGGAEPVPMWFIGSPAAGAAVFPFPFLRLAVAATTVGRWAKKMLKMQDDPARFLKTKLRGK
jgi:hypothetical protein